MLIDHDNSLFVKVQLVHCARFMASFKRKLYNCHIQKKFDIFEPCLGKCS